MKYNEIESSELDKYFIEFEKELENCEFVGCTHIKEENCGVKQACTRWKNISMVDMKDFVRYIMN